MEMKAAVDALGALAQESRLSIFRRLVTQGRTGLAAGAISNELAMPAPTLSFHLAQLEHAGLITSRREGRSIIYSANYDSMQELLGFLMENCCQGSGGDCNETVSRSRRGGKSR
jgi:ArsR family transcriptional regulator